MGPWLWAEAPSIGISLLLFTVSIGTWLCKTPSLAWDKALTSVFQPCGGLGGVDVWHGLVSFDQHRDWSSLSWIDPTAPTLHASLGLLLVLHSCLSGAGRGASVLSTPLTLEWASTQEDPVLELWSWTAWSPSGYRISGLSLQTLEAVKVAH